MSELHRVARLGLVESRIVDMISVDALLGRCSLIVRNKEKQELVELYNCGRSIRTINTFQHELGQEYKHARRQYISSP